MSTVCVLGVVCVCVLGVECDGTVSGGGEEGQVVCVPPALNHLVTVLPYQSQGQRLRQVTYRDKHTFQYIVSTKGPNNTCLDF